LNEYYGYKKRDHKIKITFFLVTKMVVFVTIISRV